MLHNDDWISGKSTFIAVSRNPKTSAFKFSLYFQLFLVYCYNAIKCSNTITGAQISSHSVPVCFCSEMSAYGKKQIAFICIYGVPSWKFVLKFTSRSSIRTFCQELQVLTQYRDSSLCEFLRSQTKQAVSSDRLSFCTILPAHVCTKRDSRGQQSNCHREVNISRTSKTDHRRKYLLENFWCVKNSTCWICRRWICLSSDFVLLNRNSLSHGRQDFCTRPDLKTASQKARKIRLTS